MYSSFVRWFYFFFFNDTATTEIYTDTLFPYTTLFRSSLSVHDQLFGARYANIINDWLRELKRGLDGRGMIPHAVHPENGKIAESARDRKSTRLNSSH